MANESGTVLRRLLGVVVAGLLAVGALYGTTVAARPQVEGNEAAEKQAGAASRPGSASRPKGAPDAAPKGADARGFMRLGTVQFHPEKKVIELAGTFNLRAGFIEFLACMPERKAHETLVAVDCRAEHLHAALLLLGLKEGKPPQTETDTRAIAGDRVVIELRWTQLDKDGKEVVVQKRAEDCIFNGLVAESMQRVGFVFTGSQFLQERVLPTGDEEGGIPTGGTSEKAGDPAEEKPVFREVFGAAVTGQLIALSHRPLAILDNPLQLPFPDADYYADTDELPPFERDKRKEVTLVIRRPVDGEIDYTIKAMKVPPPRQRGPRGQELEEPDGDGAEADESGAGSDSNRDKEDEPKQDKPKQDKPKQDKSGGSR